MEEDKDDDDTDGDMEGCYYCLRQKQLVPWQVLQRSWLGVVRGGDC